MYASTWMTLEHCIWSERSQSQKPHRVWFHLREIPRIGKSIETESRLVVAQGFEGWGKWGVTANAYGISFWGWWKCSKIDCGDGIVYSQNYGCGKMGRTLDLTSEDLVWIHRSLDLICPMTPFELSLFSPPHRMILPSIHPVIQTKNSGATWNAHLPIHHSLELISHQVSRFYFFNLFKYLSSPSWASCPLPTSSFTWTNATAFSKCLHFSPIPLTLHIMGVVFLKKTLMSLPCSKSFNGSLLCHESKHIYIGLCMPGTVLRTVEAFVSNPHINLCDRGGNWAQRGKMTCPRPCSWFSPELGLNWGTGPGICGYSCHTSLTRMEARPLTPWPRPWLPPAPPCAPVLRYCSLPAISQKGFISLGPLTMPSV